MIIRKCPLLFLLITCCSLATVSVVAAEKHVHGEAELYIAIEEEQILIEMESPADNILGFESQPSNEKQEKILSNALGLLQDYRNVIRLNTTQCSQLEADIESPFELAGHDHDKHDHDKHDEDDHDEHAKDKDHDHHGHDEKEGGHTVFHVLYKLQCEQEVEVSSVEITAFTTFKGFEEIKVNWVTPKGQGSAETKPGKAEVTF